MCRIPQLLALVFGLCNCFLADRSVSVAEEPTDPKSIRRIEGFEVELLRAAKKDEDSWISMCFDNRGRIILGLDRVGVGRLTLEQENEPRFERIENSLKHCRGVLYAHNSIYVNSTDSKKLVRLEDKDQDDVFEFRTELIQFDYRSRYGHGSNQMRLGPDGMIYVVIGNDVAFPDGTLTSSPYRNPQNDWLSPEAGDLGQDNRVGFILRMDSEGKRKEIIAGGFRNQVDLDFDDNGEMFTFDADMEWDIGAPWYRPIRVNHIVSGGEYGWRWGSGKWPAYYPDSLPSNLDVGMGSPTGVVFGTKSQFPDRYRRALLIADWQNGKILAAHKNSAGASYSFKFESFLDGAPLNVCDMEFGPDGKLYFITGGRGSQSALYRVSWSGKIAPAKTDIGLNSAQQRRREIEAFHRTPDASVIDNVWKDLGSTDPWIRHAARIAVERQPITQWENRVFTETEIDIALNALIAVVRIKESPDENRLAFHSRVAAKLAELHQSTKFDGENQGSRRLMATIRIVGILFSRHGVPAPNIANQLGKMFQGYFPHRDEHLNCELCELLVFLGQTEEFAAAFSFLKPNALSQEAQIHLARSLAHIPQPWPIQHNRLFAQWLDGAQRFRGGHLLPSTIKKMQTNFLTSLSEGQKTELVDELQLLAEPSVKNSISHTRQLVNQWKVSDLEKIDIGNGVTKRGREIYLQAQCSGCHRKNDFGAQIGPDLSTVGKRYDRAALLESLIEPSKQIDPKYALSSYALLSGKTYTGRVHGVNKTTITLETDPLRQTTVVIQRDEIEATKPSVLSPMPTGLLNTFSKREITDLLAYLISESD
ncbi:c-type cytochrome [Pirellulaceae bacterium]|nr:c-type cytochrome [Pirellulaceae bacterium]